jgi:benzoate transport
MSSLAIDPREAMRGAPMSRLQKSAVGVTFALCALDGYDVLAASFSAPAIAASWGVDRAALGVMLSAGLIGMALGSLLLAPLADRIGRRALVFIALALMGVGMGVSSTAGGVPALAFWRLVTGVGIGAMVPVINPLATEFANARWRDLAVSLMAVGYPVGGVIGGGAAAVLLRTHDWRVLFEIGALASLLLAPIVWLWLPEPLSFLIERPRPDALARINALLARCRLPAAATLPAPAAAGGARLGLLFTPQLRGITLRVTAINLAMVIGAYYVLSWIPQIVAELGFSPADAATVSLTANLAGIAGGLLLGFVSGFLPIRFLAAGAFIGFAVLLVAFTLAPANLAVLRLIAAAMGFCLYAGACSLHAIVSRSFADHVRASGAGLVFGIGRAGSALAPLVTGFLLVAGVSREPIALTLSAFIVIAAAWTLRLSTLRGAR